MIFTSEQVGRGHPDKICDQVSDTILTEYLKNDKDSRVAVETLIKNNIVVVAGEVTSKHEIDVKKAVMGVLKSVGLGNIEQYEVIDIIRTQSEDIAVGVDSGGAGDQGIMFGYATNETPEMLPIPYVLATRALEKLENLDHPQLRLDAKSQVTFDYELKRIETFLISVQHAPDLTEKELYAVVTEVMKETARDYGLNEDFNILINPTGRFVIGSSYADAGLTGRKIIADSYGGMARHGGGAFSGKDPSKVDRSGAYMARKIAKDVVRKGWCDKCEIQIGYSIGVAEPVSVSVDTYRTNRIPETAIEEYVKKYDLRPQAIIENLDLKEVDYTKTSTLGHFMKSTMPWEL